MKINGIYIILGLLLIFSIINNLMMYRKIYQKMYQESIINRLPPDVGYVNYAIFYNMNDVGKLDKLNNGVNKLKENGILIYDFPNKEVVYDDGMLYEIKKNITKF